MDNDILDIFNTRAEVQFKPLVEKYGYSLNEIKVNKYNGHKWSTRLTYVNREKDLKIDILQEPFYTDYGFSFIIYKEGTDESNILYNVPHEKQGPIATLLSQAYKDLFTNQEMIDLISGSTWRKLRRIPFQK